MKRFYIVAVLLLCVLLGGCAFWMDGEYLSVTPHQERIPQARDEVIQISNNVELQRALESLIEQGVDSGVMSASAFSRGTLTYYTDAIIENILKTHPIAAYAVDKITYEVGTNNREPVIAFRINYLHGRAEILRIKQAENMSQATNVVYSALSNCEPSLLMRVNQFETVDFVQLVQDYGNNNPDVVIEIPRVSAHVYPENGKDRVIELIFTYQTSRDKLKQMQELVAPVFTSAELYVGDTAQANEVLSRLYAFLMERNEYTIETSITPAYSLLNHGVGDSRAFANVYAKMCRVSNLDCRVVSGSREGQPWCWNVVRYRGNYYHIDLLQCKQNGSFTVMEPLYMDGYVWDYTVYPQE